VEKKGKTHQNRVSGKVNAKEVRVGKIAKLLLGFWREQSHLPVESNVGRQTANFGFDVEPSGLVGHGRHVEHALQFQHLVEGPVLMALSGISFIK